MNPSSRLHRKLLVAIPGLLATGALVLEGQLAVRPDDPLGSSLRTPRVRVLQDPQGRLPGSSLHLMATDPWLAYQRGRSYFFREWNAADGVFRYIPDRPEAASTNSCGMCHNQPFPSAGAGGTTVAQSGFGRTASHLFGAGLLETLGIQVRAQILHTFDTNRNGFLDVPEETRGRRVVISPSPGLELDFGSLEDADASGHPDLDPALQVRFVDRRGRRLSVDDHGRSPRLGDPEIIGFDLALGVFSSSAGDHQLPALRTFAEGVLVSLFGLLPAGPATPVPATDGAWIADRWGEISPSDAFQGSLFLPADPGDDPASPLPGTVGRGELDLMEWYLLHHPPPATGPQNETTRRGRLLMAEIGCTRCHVKDWQILPADPDRGLPGDRRFFHLAVSHNPETERLEGRLQDLTGSAGRPEERRPRREGFRVSGLYSDLRHHDLGPRFWEYTWLQGQLFATRRFRTTPLWGVASTGPWGHDGRSPSLDHVIRRHGGEAQAEVLRYRQLEPADRRALLDFLGSLVLYVPEGLPTDLDGDGRISADFRREERSLGPEVFRPELLFRIVPRYRGRSRPGEAFSYALENPAELYRQTLPGLRDDDRDTIPDVLHSEHTGARSSP